MTTTIDAPSPDSLRAALKALKPFADAAKTHSDNMPDEMFIDDYECPPGKWVSLAGLRLGDLRRAAEAYAALEAAQSAGVGIPDGWLAFADAPRDGSTLIDTAGRAFHWGSIRGKEGFKWKHRGDDEWPWAETVGYFFKLPTFLAAPAPTVAVNDEVLVEKVAKAIYEVEPGGNWALLNVRGLKRWKDMARAAIAAGKGE